jgi:hypothetical protein
MAKKVAHRYLDEQIAKLQKKSPQRNPRKKAPTRRKNAMATKKISSFRGDEKRVAKGMMTKGYRYYVDTYWTTKYTKTLAAATKFVKDHDVEYVRIYKLVK